MVTGIAFDLDALFDGPVTLLRVLGFLPLRLLVRGEPGRPGPSPAAVRTVVDPKAW
ncbi:hypothetical protein [Streptomyces tendae]|uniref:hypothetical protein n=1 Tax=Streptomyces tendae TaxID=1932 RepID=UPI001916869E|nr:hypothetical protein [Streptomyces tendae]